LAKALLARFAWWKMEPHPEWVEPHWTAENYQLPYAAGIPGELRIVFIPTRWDAPKVKNLEAGVSYRAFFFNCASGKEIELGKVKADTNGIGKYPPLRSLGLGGCDGRKETCCNLPSLEKSNRRRSHSC
jgi:hypothetical protein